jgi:hypothetical protein
MEVYNTTLRTSVYLASNLDATREIISAMIASDAAQRS